MSSFGSPMSWFNSFFSTKPASTGTTSEPHEKRLLEVEPADTREPQSEIPPSTPISQRRPARREEYVNPNRNKVIFGAGITFFAFSFLITRRSFARKRLAASPAFYTNAPGHHAQQAAKVSGAMEAMEALNIATINLLSVTLTAAGGALWYFDINSMADARRKLRGGLGVDGTGRDEQDAEEEFEEWMATVLSRRDAKEKTRDDHSESKRTNERGRER